VGTLGGRGPLHPGYSDAIADGDMLKKRFELVVRGLHERAGAVLVCPKAAFWRELWQILRGLPLC
jgi:hypothetical protein